MTTQGTLAGYIAFLENLKPEDLARFDNVFAAEARFRDPFNDVRGVAGIRRVFEKMFEDLSHHSFKVVDHAIGGNRAYLEWQFRFTPKGRTQPWLIEGMSIVDFDENGKVTVHIDHYDAAGQIYEKFPLIGAVLRMLRRRLAA